MKQVTLLLLLLLTVVVTACQTPAPAPPTATPLPLTEETLTAVLLEAGDIPAGWMAVPDDDEESDDSDPLGTFLCEEYERRSDLTVEAQLQRSPLGPFLFQVADGYAPDVAAAVFADLTDIFAACSTWTRSFDDGSAWEMEATALPFPDLGDEVLAVRMFTGDSPVGQLETHIVKIRQGNVILTLSHAAVGPAGVEVAQTETFARLLLQRLNALPNPPQDGESVG